MNFTIANCLLVILAGFFLNSCNQTTVSTQKNSPNILLILTDDMGYGDVANSGNPIIRTPHLDQLAEQSVRFENFYVSSVCAPTRASLLTGRYHQRTGVRSVTNGFETIDPDEITLAETLKENGYRTGIFGKWHLGEYYPSVPNAQGFDEYLGFRTGHTNYYYDATIEHNGKPIKTRGHITDVLTEGALNFITADTSQPFFCYLTYNAPHTPLQVDSSWWQPYIEQGLEEKEARIYGMIEHLDLRIGQLLDTLQKKKILDNTMVIFMSDNGPINGWRVPQQEMRYNAGLRDQKFTVYDGGIRTQCYWMWKDHWRPAAVSQIAAHIDALPTLMDVLGISTINTAEIDGISLKTSLDTGTDTDTNRVFYQKYSLETLRDPAPFPGGIARKGPWKMVNGTDLYNLENDIGEQVNLARKHPEIFEELSSSYMNWYENITDDRGLAQVPITVGHAQENPVHLQPHHAQASGNVKFWGNRGLTGERRGTHPVGVDSDWTGGWQGSGDALEWTVSFALDGEYRFKVTARDTTMQKVQYLNLYIDEQAINSAKDLTLNKNWSESDLGSVTANQGPHTLRLALGNDIASGLEVRSLVVERQIIKD